MHYERNRQRQMLSKQIQSEKLMKETLDLALCEHNTHKGINRQQQEKEKGVNYKYTQKTNDNSCEIAVQKWKV